VYKLGGLVDSVGLILFDELVPRPIMWESGWGSRTAEFETFRRCFGVWVITGSKRCRTYGAPTARRGRRDHHPLMPQPPGWADVWRAGPPGLRSGWVFFCGSLTQELIMLWHCQRPERQRSGEICGFSFRSHTPSLSRRVRRYVCAQRRASGEEGSLQAISR
jgi:hypothetical protein